MTPIRRPQLAHDAPETSLDPETGTDPEASPGPDTVPERSTAPAAETSPDLDTDGGDPGAAADDDGPYPLPDWSWVREWEDSGEPPAYGPGLFVAGFVAVLVGTAILAVSLGMTQVPVLAVLSNVLIAAGLAPALWYSRRIPVLRWVAAGAAIGLVLGWIGLITAQRL